MRRIVDQSRVENHVWPPNARHSSAFAEFIQIVVIRILILHIYIDRAIPAFRGGETTIRALEYMLHVCCILDAPHHFPTLLVDLPSRDVRRCWRLLSPEANLSTLFFFLETSRAVNFNADYLARDRVQIAIVCYLSNL